MMVNIMYAEVSHISRQSLKTVPFSAYFLAPLRLCMGLLCALLVLSVLAACSSGPTTLTVDIADGIIIKPELIQEFEKANDAKVVLRSVLSAEAMVSKPITADVAYGLDSYTAGRAIGSGQFEGYAAIRLDKVPATFRADAKNTLVPIDVNYVTVNYDKNWFAMRGISQPTTLKGLTDKAYFHRFVLTNPDNTPIGLGFLLMTIGSFPQGSDYPWQQFWRDLQMNAMHPVPSWNEAYGLQFTASQRTGAPTDGLHPLCLSFAAAAVADMQFNNRTDSVIGNIGDTGFAQVRYAGITKTSPQRKLAEKFIDLLLSENFQKELAPQMFVYPARSDITLPERFAAHAPPPKTVLALSPEMIEQNRQRWIDEWKSTTGSQ